MVGRVLNVVVPSCDGRNGTCNAVSSEVRNTSIFLYAQVVRIDIPRRRPARAVIRIHFNSYTLIDSAKAHVRSVSSKIIRRCIADNKDHPVRPSIVSTQVHFSTHLPRFVDSHRIIHPHCADLACCIGCQSVGTRDNLYRITDKRLCLHLPRGQD